MKRSFKWGLLILAGILLLPVLYFIWPGVFTIAVIAGMIVLKAKFPVIKGQVGEWQVTRILENLGEEYQVYNDIYVPKEDGGMAQVDHIVTSPWGIFVIETKHYTGWIFGSEHQAQWTQIIYKRKEKMYNPIRQNYGHVMSLKSYLGNAEPQLFHSVIAFSPQSAFKFKEPFKSAAVVQFPELPKVIREKQNVVFSKLELDAVNEKLERLIISDRKEKKRIKKEHLKLIRSRKIGKELKKQEEAVPSTSNGIKKRSNMAETKTGRTEAEVCAACGSAMKLKQGRYGSFYGCSNYPVCRHTKKLAKSS